MKEHQRFFQVTLFHLQLCRVLLGSVLLAGFAARAEATICIEPPVVAVKEVKGLAVSESSQGGLAEEALWGVRVQLFREAAKGWILVAQGVTDAEGSFYLTDIKPGVYRIEADSDGFFPAEGRLRVRRFFPVSRGTLMLVLAYPQVGGCGGWIELRKAKTEPRAMDKPVNTPDANRVTHGRRRMASNPSEDW